MLSERLLSSVVGSLSKRQLVLSPTTDTHLPAAKPGVRYMLYLHVPFCERLCPYCSFNRYPLRESVARPYFEQLRAEMMMLPALGYDIESLYFGGGTPTVLVDELCATIDLARDTWDIREVSCETNPNHLTTPYLNKMRGRVQRLSVGVQSFNDDLLRQMDRYDKYGSGAQIMDRLGEAIPYFDSINVDMMFNYPRQTEDELLADLERIVACGCRQTTFSPLYQSNATMRKMQSALGQMDYGREYRYYRILDGVLAGGDRPLFDRQTVWTFNRAGQAAARAHGLMVEEYMVGYEEYPAIGSGSITNLDGRLFVNHFGLRDYAAAIEAGRMSVMGSATLSQRNLMRYRFLAQLYSLRFDKRQFERDFGCGVDAGLPAEMAFMRLHRAFATDDADELTLTPMGRYLVLVMYRKFLSGMNNLREQARAALTGPERELMFGDGGCDEGR